MRIQTVVPLLLTAAICLTPGHADAQGAISWADAVAVAEPPVVDGRLDDAAWQQAPRLGPCFVLGETEEHPAAATYFRVVWTPTTLYVAASCDEPREILSRLRSPSTTARCTPTTAWRSSWIPRRPGWGTRNWRSTVWPRGTTPVSWASVCWPGGTHGRPQPDAVEPHLDREDTG